MAGKAKALRENYGRFIQGDLEGALDRWADDIVWEGDNSGLPGSERHEGRQAATAVLVEAIGAYDKFELSPEEFFEQGDTVVVLGHQTGTKGDRSATLPFVHVWRYRGEQVCRVQLMSDTLTTARLLGMV